VSGILVVEDDEIIGSALADLLSGDGHHVRWMRNGM